MQIRHRRRFVALTAGALLATVLALPGIASADTGGGGTIEPAFSHNATVTVVAVTFQSKLLVNATLDITCDPFLEQDWDGIPTGNSTTDGAFGASVQLLQAQGRSIAHGSGGTIGALGAMSVTCDGSTFRVTVPIVAQDLPFKRGDALLGAYVGIDAAVPCCSNWSFDQASSGPVTARIR